MKLTEAVKDFQYKVIKYFLLVNHGNIRKTAKCLGKHPATIQRWVQLLNLQNYADELRRSDNRKLSFLLTHYLF
jgi:transcriptional regulator with GAF, ATPase, and Fis domain